MSNLMWGRYHWGRHIWAGLAGGGIATEQEVLIDNCYCVTAYAADGTKTAIFGGGSEADAIKELTFEIGETGCATATLKFTKLPTTAELNYRQRIDISLFNARQPLYSGYIMTRPADGTTAGASGQTFTFKAYGYYNWLDKVLITATYENMEVSAIVKAIATTIESKVGLAMNESKIVSTTYTITKIAFDHTTAKDALKQLADFAVDYVYGVDEDRNLFFKPRNNEINEQARFWVGEHITSFLPELDADSIANHVYVKGGALDAEGEQWLAEVSDATSIATYGYCEETIDLPSAYSATDAQRYGQNYVNNHKNPTESAKVKGLMLEYANTDGSFNFRHLTTQGKAYIVDRAGTAHTLPITKLKYTISAEKGITCDMTLGNPPDEVDKYLAMLDRNYRNQQALQDAANKQLV